MREYRASRGWSRAMHGEVVCCSAWWCLQVSAASCMGKEKGGKEEQQRKGKERGKERDGGKGVTERKRGRR